MPVQDSDQWVLQLCHSYYSPFMDCARQYASLFSGEPYKVLTVYLTGKPSEMVAQGSASDEVVFLNYSSRDLRGMKRPVISDVRRLAKSRNFVACISHRMKPTYVALMAASFPVFSVNHAFDVYRRWGRRFFISLFFRRLTLIGVSDAVRDDIRRCLPFWPSRRIVTLYNRIDVNSMQAEQLGREEARSALQIPSEAWVVANVGRLHPDKDQATLIRAFAKAVPCLPEHSRLIIAGEGKLESELVALVGELGVTDYVYFLGMIPSAYRYFSAFDVFALSSECESFGMVLLEAMAAGVPLICSDCGGGREVVEGVGMLFPLGDAEALAAQMITQSELGESEINKIKVAEQERLKCFFSDEAGKEHFFSYWLSRK